MTNTENPDDDFLPPGYNDPLPEMARRDADPIGFIRAMEVLDPQRDADAVIAIAVEWARPATRREVQLWQQRSAVSACWDRTHYDLTRVERAWLVERFISPASKVAAADVLEAYRAGYEQGRSGGER